VDGNKHLKIKKDQVEKIEGNMFLTVGKGRNPEGGNQDIVIEKEKKELIELNSHLHVKGARKEKIDGDQSLTVGVSQQEKVGMKHALEAGQEIHLKAGMKVIIEAGLQLTIKGAGGFIDIGPAGITIEGLLVRVNSGGAPGSGSGSSPEAPEDAVVANPTPPSPVAGGESTPQLPPTRESRLPREE
jgi:type VI secretion system secreted protein VgrG